MNHGDIINVGKVSLEAIYTPGHTPEHLSFLLTDHPATDEPNMLFSGDFVFVGAVNMSTIGYEKIRNWALQLLDDKAAFTKELLADQPEPPKYFSMMKKLNKEERKLLTEVPKTKNLNQDEYQEAKKKKLKLIDA